jgi:hypothetical protein
MKKINKLKMEDYLLENAKKGYVFYSTLNFDMLMNMANTYNRNITIKEVIVCNIKSKIRTCSWLNEITIENSAPIKIDAIRSVMGYLINFGENGEFAYIDKPSKDINSAFIKAKRRVQTEASIVIGDLKTLETKTIFKTTIVQ